MLLRSLTAFSSLAFLPAGVTRLLCALIFLGTVGFAHGTTWTWTGNGGNVNWSTVGNWGGTAPASAATTDLIFAGSTNTGTALVPLNQNIATPFLLNSLTFNSSAGSFFLGGGALRFDGGSTNSILQSSSNAQSIANAINAPSTNASMTITLGGNGTGLVTMSGIISAGSGNRDYAITKTGTSSFVLSGANTYGGLTTVTSGVLNIQNSNALGATTSGTSVASGAALQLQGGIAVGTEALTLNGSGIAANGALRNISGNNSYAGGITLASASQIDSDSGTLTLSGNINNGGFLLTESGAGNVTVTSVISGTGGLTKTGSGTLTLSGAASNTYTGATTVNQGTLILAKPGSVLAPAITIGGAGSTATVQLNAAYQLYGAATTINALGQLNLNNFAEYVGTLTLNGGSVVTGTGTLYMGGGIVSTASNTTATMTGNYTFYTSQIFNIASGTTGTGVDVSISGPIGETGDIAALTKQGTGKLVLSGANSYSGLTTISTGVLNIQNATALGTTAAGTSVTSGAALQIEGNIAVGNEALTLNGGGISSDGALRNISGNNSFAGTITLGSASTIYSDAGTLTLSGGMVTGGFTATFGGAGNITQSGGVISGTGGLIKNDAGTLTLNGANTYSGGSTINGGTVITYGGSLGATSGTATLNAATIEVAATYTSTRNYVLGSATSTIMVDPTFTFTANGIFSGTGTLNKTGSGTMVLGGVNLFSGGTNVAGGTLQLSAANRLLTTAGLTISGGTFDLQTFGQTTGAVTLSSGTISGTGVGTLTGSSYTLQSGTVSAILAGTGAVTKNTSGSVTLSGANTFTGSTTISAGTLQVNTNNALGSAASGTTVANGAVLNLNNVNYATAEPLTLNGSGISNGGALTNSGTSTFAGPINAATNARINAGGGTLNLTGGISKNGTTLTIAGGGTVNINTNGITGSAPNSDLVVDGTVLVLNAASSYNGPTTIQNSGTLQLGGNNFLPTAPQTAMTINTGSIFDLAGHSDGVASLTGDSTGTVKNSVVGGTSTVTINPASGSTTFAGVIAGTNGGLQGNIALQKNGAGTLILTGANTYSGSTTINGGTLTLADTSGSALGSTSSVTVGSGGTLLLGHSDQINNSATMALAGGTFAKGNFSEGTAGAPGVGALTLTASGSQIDFGTGTVGVLTFASFTPGSFTLTIDNWTGTPDTVGNGSTDRLIFASDQSANLSSFAFNGFSPGVVQFDLGNGYYEITPGTVAPVPETSTWVAAALALGVAGWHFARRCRAKTRRA